MLQFRHGQPRDIFNSFDVVHGQVKVRQIREVDVEDVGNDGRVMILPYIEIDLKSEIPNFPFLDGQAALFHGFLFPLGEVQLLLRESFLEMGVQSTSLLLVYDHAIIINLSCNFHSKGGDRNRRYQYPVRFSQILRERIFALKRKSLILGYSSE